jgi:basic membrane protein A and related proteins
MTTAPFVTRAINRRTLVIGSAAAAALAPVARFGIAGAQSDIVATGVTDTAGLGDQNFNDLANKGGNDAAAEYGITWNILESQNAADYIPNLTRAAESSELTVAIGFLLTDAVAEVAAQFADRKFMIIDSVVEADNVASLLFKEQEGAFLAGICAGLMAGEERKVGFVGGIRIPPVMRYEVGYVAGIKSVAPDVEVLISYADDFENPTLGKELTLAQYDQGANIVLAAAGRTGIGAFDAAKEKGEGVYVIAADADQAHLGPEFQLCAVAKRIDEAVVRVVGQVVDNAFEGGIQDLGIADDGVGLIAYNETVPQETQDTVQAFSDAIASGEIVPPVDDETLAAFEPVDLSGGAAATPAS